MCSVFCMFDLRNSFFQMRLLMKSKKSEGFLMIILNYPRSMWKLFSAYLIHSASTWFCHRKLIYLYLFLAMHPLSRILLELGRKTLYFLRPMPGCLIILVNWQLKQYNVGLQIQDSVLKIEQTPTNCCRNPLLGSIFQE